MPENKPADALDYITIAKKAAESNALFSDAMKIEDRLFEEGKYVESAYIERELTSWAVANCATIAEGDVVRTVTKKITEIRGAENTVTIIPVGMEMEAAMRMVLKAKPHLAPPGPPSDLAEMAFGPNATLKAQKMFLETECLGSTDAAIVEAKKWGRRGLGDISPADPARGIGVRAGAKQPNKSAAALASAENPWLLPKGHANFEERARKIIMGPNGTQRARELSAAAGKTLGNDPLRPPRAF